MTAIAILAAGAVSAFLYGRAVNKLNGEEMMGLGVLVLVPWAIIAIATVAALIVLT